MKTKINNTKKWMVYGVLCCLLAPTLLLLSSCKDDDGDAPLNFYSSVRLTAAGFIEADEARFSDFKAILERSHHLGMLKTYGEYTVFAPTNDQFSAEEVNQLISRRTVFRPLTL